MKDRIEYETPNMELVLFVNEYVDTLVASSTEGDGLEGLPM